MLAHIIASISSNTYDYLRGYLDNLAYLGDMAAMGFETLLLLYGILMILIALILKFMK